MIAVPFFLVGIVRSSNRCLLVLGVAALAAASGCSKADGDDFVPVSGTVLLDGHPLKIGAVAFEADHAKGNKTMHVPTGTIDSQGKFELVTIGIKGAPKGWYKVLVYADENALIEGNSSRPPIPKWMTHEKYTDRNATPLSVEVVEKPAPGAYDLVVTK